MDEVSPVNGDKHGRPGYHPDWLSRPDTRALVLGGLGLLFFLLAFATLTFPDPWDLRRIIWLPSGVALAAAVILGLRVWPAILVAAFAATMATTGPLLHGIGTALANTGEVVLAVYLLRRVGFDPRLGRGRDVVALLILGAAIPALVMALLSVGTLSLSGGNPDSFARVWFYWALTHAMGALVVAPVLLTAWARRKESFEGSLAEGAILTAVLILAGAVVFGPISGAPDSPLRIEFAILPVLLWGAFRFGPTGAALGSFLVAVTAIVGTINGFGPFVTTSANTTLFLTWSYVNITAIPTLLVAAIVMQRRKTQRALAESESRVRTLLDATGDGILVLDRKGGVQHANRRFTEMWQISEDVWAASRSSDVLLREMANRLDDRTVLEHATNFVEMMASQLTQKEASMEKIVLRNGSVLHQYSVPCPEETDLIGRIWSYRDVTAIERAEAERLRLERQMQHAQKLKSLGLLAGGIAHDFNNLLLAIVGYADLSLDSLPQDAEARGYLTQIVKATQRASGLSKQMLAYSGRGTFVVEPVDLVSTVKETSGLLESSISKRAKLVYDFAPDLPHILADGVQIHQIVMNLVTNASDALQGEDGQIRVSVGVDTFDREYLSSCYVDDGLPAGQYVYLEVADTGIGMDAETRAKIFDPFFTSKGTGRGLGLAAALGIIRGHKGAVRVDTRPGLGSVFRVLFPASDVSVTAPDVSVIEDEPWSGRGKILVVDDEEVVRDLASQILQRIGFSVLEAVDGINAVEVFRDHAGELDLVLLDMTMPRLDGADVLGQMQQIDPRVPVILSSGYTETEMAERVTDSAIAGFLQKPYRRSTLVTMTREVLRRNTHRSLVNVDVTS